MYVHCRYNLFTGCVKAKTCTIVLRGGAEQFIEETERSLHDAIMIVRRTIKNDAIVAGMRLLQETCLMSTLQSHLATVNQLFDNDGQTCLGIK